MPTWGLVRDPCSPSPPVRRRRCQGFAARRGFALLLVLALVLVIALLLLAFLRVMERRARLPRTSIHGAEHVAEGVVDLFTLRLADDLPLAGKNQENYDCPWTDTSVRRMPAALGYPVPRSDRALGDPCRDDAWLADTCPRDGVWPHLSNLTGAFLDVRDANLMRVDPHPATSARVPGDRLSDGLETGLSVGDPRLVDADGDGIGDSLWFYPPAAVFEGRRYVAAVCIEDLSAKLPLNAALLRTAPAADGARSPCDLDLGALARLFGADPAELDAAARFRAGDGDRAQLYPLLPELAWLDRASHAQSSGEPLTNDTRRYGIADEFELRFRGGLNEHRAAQPGAAAPAAVTTPVEAAGTGLPRLLRADRDETHWSEAGFPSADAFLLTNPRRWVTALGGESSLVVGLPLDPAGGTRLRFNPNLRNPAALGPLLRDGWALPWMAGPDRTPGTADDWPGPPGWAAFWPAGADGLSAKATQWCANLADARDKDNLVTQRDGWLGWEPLPMPTAAYLQAYYTAGGVRADGGGQIVTCERRGRAASFAIELANPWEREILLTHVHLSAGLPGLSCLPGGAATVPVSSLLGAWPDRNVDGDPVLKPGHALLLWDNGAGGTTDTDIGAEIRAAEGRDPGRVHAVRAPSLRIGSLPAGTDPDLIRIGLHYETESESGLGPAIAPYPYQWLTLPWLCERFEEYAPGTTHAGTGGVGYRQSCAQGFGIAEGLNLLQCLPAMTDGLSIASPVRSLEVTGPPAALGDMRMDFTFATQGYDPRLPRILGQPVRMPVPAGRTDLRRCRIFSNRPAHPFEDGRFGSVADLLAVPLIGPRGEAPDHRGPLTARDARGIPTQTGIAHALVAELDGGRPFTTLFPPLMPGAAPFQPAPPDDAPAHTRVPWAWTLPAFLDCLNPAQHGGHDLDRDGAPDWSSSSGSSYALDANGNGVKDWPSEVDWAAQLVPGRVNLNTAPPHLLAQMLPADPPAFRTALAGLIAALRASPPADGVRRPTDRGLSNAMEVLPQAAMLPDYPRRPLADLDGDGRVDADDVGRVDLAQDFGFLLNASACRSDFYAMHLLVQGYPADDFSGGPVESVRWLVLASRAAATSPDAPGQVRTWIFRY